MNEKTIRRPTGSAVLFLISAFSYFCTLANTVLLTQLIDYPKEMPISGVFKIIILGATNLFMSIILFSKKYNNMLIVGSGVLLIPSIFTLFLNISPYIISEIIFYLVLFAFTYIMIKMPGTPIREKAVKFRFIIPALQFALILISTIQTTQRLYENLTETMGTFPDAAVSAAITLVPSILGAITSFLPVLCYVWLANWMANPYEKQT